MSLAIVVPVYNEKKNIVKLLNDWNKEVKKNYKKKYKFIIVDDGSTDGSDKAIKSIKSKNFFYKFQKNSGHANACLKGYKIAIKLKFKLILQIDSDNQCDPIYFKDFLKLSKNNKIIFGHRTSREDGFLRLIFSRILSLLIYFKTFIFVKDANVPYRLFTKDILLKVIKKIPTKVILKNVYLSYLFEKNFKIKWINMNFRERYYGETTHGFKNLIKQLLNLMYYI